MTDAYEVEMSPDVIEQISVVAAAEAARVFDSLTIKEQERKAKDRHNRAQRILSVYRRARRIVGESEEFTEDEKIEIRMKFLQDLMGDSIRYPIPDKVVQKENDRIETNRYCVYDIDRALKHYAEELEGLDVNDERVRAYRVMSARFIDEPEKTIDEIAENEGITVRTAYRDISKAVEVMAFYMDLRTSNSVS